MLRAEDWPEMNPKQSSGGVLQQLRAWLRRSSTSVFVSLTCSFEVLATDCFMLAGVLYAEGRRVAKDKSRAVQWWQAAAAQGHAQAQYSLGTSAFSCQCRSVGA
jgi:TPR repeat protein